jgi:REP element-mobilizing transposase RayT
MNQTKPQRRTIRLPDWDYRTAAYYFITICTHQRQHFFDDPRLHEIAANAWAYIPQQPHARHVEIDAGVIMPDHTHGIIQILVNPETAVAPSNQPQRAPAGSLGAIVGNYKMLVTKRVKAMLKASGTDMKVWQRGYWERIIRNERELNATRQYIQDNPLRWHENRDNLDKLLGKMHYVDGR